ncbi:MAG: hypothetical protein QOJ35_3138 [Solirubrobacteraceae bacterium]|nr:hypothetical protein [Solirubrobacteraceae bacterium]
MMANGVQVDDNAASVHMGKAKDAAMGANDATALPPVEDRAVTNGKGAVRRRPSAKAAGKRNGRAGVAVAANGAAVESAGAAAVEEVPPLAAGATVDAAPALGGGARGDAAPVLAGGALVDDAPVLAGGALVDAAPVLGGGAPVEDAPASAPAFDDDDAAVESEPEPGERPADDAPAPAMPGPPRRAAGWATPFAALLRARAVRSQRARRAVHDTPAARRAALVASSASYAAAARAKAADPPPAHRRGTIARRIVACVAILMLPASVSALVVSGHTVSRLSQADATFLGGQLVRADQRVRRQLEHLRPLQTARAVARTRDGLLTARSLALEVARTRGAEAVRLRHALALEADWLDAVGSTLSNPRSALRDELAARDGALRPALAALPVAQGPRIGGAEHLVRYALARAAATDAFAAR